MSKDNRKEREKLSHLSFWLMVGCFGLLFGATPFLSLIYDVSVYDGYMSFWEGYALLMHAALFVALKAAQLSMVIYKHKLATDFVLAHLGSDVVDRALGVTWFDWKDILITVVFFLGLAVKHRKKLTAWISTKRFLPR